MTRLTAFLRDERGAAAAEFALVLPIFLIFMVGTMDVGLYAWQINRGEKATQTGARWAVATQMLPGGTAGCGTAQNNGTPGLLCYSYATDGNYTQGQSVAEADFPTITCTGTADGLSCTCAACPFSVDASSTESQAAYNALLDRMQDIMNSIESDNVEITYSWSGLGFAGDPNGPDVAPIVTVRLTDMEFQPVTTLLLGAQLDLPEFSYSLTAEDSVGAFAN